MLMVLLMMLMALLMMMMLTIFIIRRASRAQRGSPAGRAPQFNHPSVSTVTLKLKLLTALTFASQCQLAAVNCQLLIPILIFSS